MPRKEIDPQLPYTQVHRSSAQKAAALAPLIHVTPQHARGSVLEFWERLSDRRTLKRGLERAGGAAIVLTRAEAEAHLMHAFGMKVEPDLIVTAGFLEPLTEGLYRVRGMSRQLETEAKRLRSRGWKPPGDTSGGTSGVPEVAPKSPQGTPASPPEVIPGATDVRRETEDVRLKTEEQQQQRPKLVHGPLVYEPPTTPPEQWLFPDFEAWFQCRRQAAGLPAESRRLGHREGATWWSACLMTPNVNAQVLKRAVINGFGQDKHWEAEGFPMRGFISQWDKYVSKEVSRATASR